MTQSLRRDDLLARRVWMGVCMMGNVSHCDSIVGQWHMWAGTLCMELIADIVCARDRGDGGCVRLVGCAGEVGVMHARMSWARGSCHGRRAA